MTLVSYVPKMDKCVLLLSTMHHDNTIIPQNNNKPEIICYYNSTKAGVDVVDELKGTYSVARKCNRWSLRLFFSVLNMTGVNAQIIVNTNKKNSFVRRQFLKELALNLIQKHIHARSKITTLPLHVKYEIQKIMKQPHNERESVHPGRCYFCPTKKNRKTKKQCSNCKAFICNEHTVYFCRECPNNASESELSSDE